MHSEIFLIDNQFNNKENYNIRIQNIQKLSNFKLMIENAKTKIISLKIKKDELSFTINKLQKIIQVLEEKVLYRLNKIAKTIISDDNMTS